MNMNKSLGVALTSAIMLSAALVVQTVSAGAVDDVSLTKSGKCQGAIHGQIVFLQNRGRDSVKSVR